MGQWISDYISQAPSLGPMLIGALGLAFIHTVLGVDHYLPFVMLGRSESWTLRRTLASTFVCGVTHVLGSIVVAGCGAALGFAGLQIAGLDLVRADLSAYLLIGFGFIYLIHAITKAPRTGAEKQAHLRRRGGRTLWTLIVVFLLGPCEPLVPLLLVPTLAQNTLITASVVLVFAVGTIGTMIVMVTLGHWGLNVARTQTLAGWAPSLSGLSLVLSGALILAGF